MENHELLNAIAGLMDEKLTPINKRLDRIESRLDTIEGKIDVIESRLDTVEGKIEVIENRLDTVEENIAMINGRLDTIECRLDDIETNMVTKEDLRAAENMILGELDTVQEKTNQKFENLRFEVV